MAASVWLELAKVQVTFSAGEQRGQNSVRQIEAERLTHRRLVSLDGSPRSDRQREGLVSSGSIGNSSSDGLVVEGIRDDDVGSTVLRHDAAEVVVLDSESHDELIVGRKLSASTENSILCTQSQRQLRVSKRGGGDLRMYQTAELV